MSKAVVSKAAVNKAVTEKRARQSRLFFAFNRLVTAMAVVGLLAGAPMVFAQQAPQPTAVLVLDIQPGSLSSALNQVARLSGIALSYDPALTANKTTTGLQGSYTLAQALDQLLSGTGIESSITGKRVTLTKVAPLDSAIVQLAPIRVVGSDPSRYAAHSASSATGSEVNIMDVPRSVQVIPEQIIIDQQSKDLRDILRNVSGIQARNISGGTTDAFFLRGVEVQNIFQDGFQLDRSSTRIQASNIERVEVVKGPNAILVGQSQAGGVINIITKRPQAEPRHVMRVSADEFGQREWLLDTTGRVGDNDNLLYRVVGSIEDSETFRKANNNRAEVKRKLFAPSLTWHLSERDSLSISAEFISAELPFDNGTVLTQAADGRLGIADNSRSERFGEDGDISDNIQRTLRLEYEHAFDDGWLLESNVSYQSANGSQLFTGATLGVDALTPGIPVITSVLLGALSGGVNANAVPENGALIRSLTGTSRDRDRFQFGMRFSGEARLGSTVNHLTIGADYNRRNSKSSTRRAYITSQAAGFGTLPGLPPLPGVLLSDFSALDINNPVFGQLDSELRTTTQVENTDTQIGLFLTDNIDFNQHWKALVGLRFDRFERDGDDTLLLENIAPVPGLPGLEAVAVQASQTRLSRAQDAQTEFSPSVGVVYQPNESLSLFSSYSEAFMPQFLTNAVTGEVIDSNPIESDQIELGIKMGLLDDRLIVNASYYDITRNNVPGVNNLVTGELAFNEEEVRRGVELDTSVQFASGLSLIFNYAHTIEAEIKQGANRGNTPGNAAKNIANLWATYEFTQGALRGLGVGGGVRYIGKRFVTDSNLFELDSYTTFDATAFYYLPVGNEQQLRLQFGIKNITDEEYHIANNSTLSLGVGAPRTIYSSIKFEF